MHLNVICILILQRTPGIIRGYLKNLKTLITAYVICSIVQLFTLKTKNNQVTLKLRNTGSKTFTKNILDVIYKNK